MSENPNAITAQRSEYGRVAEMLQGEAMQRQLAAALPKHVTPQRLARIVLTCIRSTPKLLDCTRESLLGSIMQAAQLGLEPGTLGQCWIIPYKQEATFVPGYRGLCQLAWRSAQVASINAHAVYEGDDFDFDLGSDTVRHVPVFETDPAKLTHAWAIIRTTGGGTILEVMGKREIEAIQKRSAAGRSGPWITDTAEMWKKTVLKRALKRAPASAELQAALTLDEQADTGASQGLAFGEGLFEDAPERDVTPAAEEEPEVDPETGEIVPPGSADA